MGARYLDPKYSRWISVDPALGEYIPQAPVSDEARKHNQNLPGMGGVFNHINGDLYAYGANNPVRYVDPDGRKIDAAIEILKSSNNLSDKTKGIISVKKVENLYKAESRRLSFLERIGIDGATIGRGQVGEDAYNDVWNLFKSEMKKYESEVRKKFSGDFKKDMKNTDLEDFIVAAYLSICIDRRQKEGRSAEDAAKFGIGYYHGGKSMIVKAQAKEPNIITFAGTEKALKNGTKEEKDLLNYIMEVFDEK